MDFNSTAVLGALALLIAGYLVTLLRGLKASQESHSEKLVRIETLLTVANGRTGKLEKWREELDEEAIPRRMIELERRHGPDDRRQVIA